MIPGEDDDGITNGIQHEMGYVRVIARFSRNSPHSEHVRLSHIYALTHTSVLTHTRRDSIGIYTYKRIGQKEKESAQVTGILVKGSFVIFVIYFPKSGFSKKQMIVIQNLFKQICYIFYVFKIIKQL